MCVYVCGWGARGTLGFGTNKRFFFFVSTESISISHHLSQLDTRLPIASYWQNYCGNIAFVYAFEVVYLTLIVCVVALLYPPCLNSK